MTKYPLPRGTAPRRRNGLLLGMKLGLCAAALQAMIPAASAADPDKPAFADTTLTGDWNGERTKLYDKGIDFNLGYVSEIANNVRGGSSEKTAYTDQWSLGTKLDLQKLLGLNNAKFEFLITNRDGRNLSDDADLHTLQQVQELYGRGQTWRLTRLSYEQAWLDGTIDLKLGRLPVGDDFASFSCDFQNLTFCGSQPGNVRGELWYSYPVSQWGTRLKVATSAETSVEVGVYQVNPTYIDDDYAHHGGLYPNNPSGTTGALIPIEFAWKPKLAGLPGSYKLGAWYDTSNANDVFLDTNHQPLAITGGTPLQRNSRSGVYVNFAQQVNGEDGGSGATVFFNATQSDKETATSMDRQFALGVTYKGLIPSRAADTLGFAIGANHFNTRVADGIALSDEFNGEAVPVPGTELVSELFYAWTPRPWISLQPNVQYVRHPGGVGENESVVVLGLRTSVVF